MARIRSRILEAPCYVPRTPRASERSPVALAVHLDAEVSVFGEQGLLSLGVAAIGAASVFVDELTDRQPVRGLFG